MGRICDLYLNTMGAQVEGSAEAISSFYLLFPFLERMGFSIYFCFFLSALHFLAVFFNRNIH